MKRRYLFLRHPEKTAVGDYVYCVWVGESAREQAKKTLVEEYCKDVGMYFHMWDNQTSSALEMAYDRFRNPRNKLSSPYIYLECSVKDLYRMIIDDTLDAFEQQSVLSETEIFQRYWNTSEYALRNNNLQCNTSCRPYGRKNLSDADGGEGYKAAMALLGILGLFLVDAAVSGILNWLFNGSF